MWLTDAFAQLDVTTVLVFLVVLLIANYLFGRPADNLPPGPWAMPLLGSVGFLRKMLTGAPYLVVSEMAETYGSVIGVRIGGKLIVFLHGYDTIHQALVTQAPDLNDRPNWIPRIAQGLLTGKGISWQNGTAWKRIRKFVVNSLREFGVGKITQEQNVTFEVGALTELLEKREGQPFQIVDLMQMAVSNVICSVVFGRRFDFDDKDFQRVLKNLDIQLSGNDGFVSVPAAVTKVIKWFFPKKTTIYEVQQRASIENRTFISKQIEDHKLTFDPKSPRDIVDLYLQVYMEEKNTGTVDEVFSSGNIQRVIMDLFLAGSETTSTLLNWCFLYMIEYPDVQRKCQAIIDKVAGDREVKWADRADMSFVESTIQEVQRLSHVVPFSVPRTSLKDVYLNGYLIPARTVVLPSLYSTDMDPKYWTDPHTFKPDRFLDQTGKLTRKESFMPFSTGPRNCPGELLARMELFLIFTGLLQRFNFRRENENRKHDFSCKKGHVITLQPAPYKLVVTKRV